MKNFSTAFAAHIATGATTLSTCWLIERTDSIKLGFTDHDRVLVFEGHSFIPANGLDGSEVTAKLGGQVDTSEVTGILHSAAISEEDISLGRYRGAKVTTYMVNWRDPAIREVLRVDIIGEITREDGIFRAELRSRQQALNIAKGRRYQSLCDTLVGTARCRVNTESSAFKGTGNVVSVKNRFTLEVNGLNAFSSGWFARGKAIWQTGKRHDLTDNINAHNLASGIVSLGFTEAVGDWVEAGDELHVYVGCNRLFSTCKNKFSNSANFQGFPHIPGNDFLLSYPRPGDSSKGSALIE